MLYMCITNSIACSTTKASTAATICFKYKKVKWRNARKSGKSTEGQSPRQANAPSYKCEGVCTKNRRTDINAPGASKVHKRLSARSCHAGIYVRL